MFAIIKKNIHYHFKSSFYYSGKLKYDRDVPQKLLIIIDQYI